MTTVRALEAAILDQRAMVTQAMQVGWDPTPWRDEMERLKMRLMEYQKRSLDSEFYGSD